MAIALVIIGKATILESENQMLRAEQELGSKLKRRPRTSPELRGHLRQVKEMRQILS